jgi:hypothetical protein
MMDVAVAQSSALVPLLPVHKIYSILSFHVYKGNKGTRRPNQVQADDRCLMCHSERISLLIYKHFFFSFKQLIISFAIYKIQVQFFNLFCMDVNVDLVLLEQYEVNVLSRSYISINGVWIGNRIYRTLTDRNYN